MKRFFCTVCKRVKRVQNYPVIIENPTAYDVVQRVGVCNFHSSSFRSTRQSVNRPVEMKGAK